MSEDDLPRTIIVLLAVFSIASFAAGSALEMARPDLLFRHPYWVNLLSGMTGFTTSGFIISVLFRRIQRRQQRRAFAGRAGPEINQIATDADAALWEMLGRLDEDVERGGIGEAAATVRAVRQRIDGVREIGAVVATFLHGVKGTSNQPVRRDAILFGRYESMSAAAMAAPPWEIPADIRDEAHDRVGALATLAEGSGLAEMTERGDTRIVLARLRRETAAWRADPDVHQLMQTTLDRLRELMIGGAHRDFETEIEVALRAYEDVATRPVSIVRSLATLAVTALELSGGDRFSKEILRELGME